MIERGCQKTFKKNITKVPPKLWGFPGVPFQHHQVLVDFGPLQAMELASPACRLARRLPQSWVRALEYRPERPKKLELKHWI